MLQHSATAPATHTASQQNFKARQRAVQDSLTLHGGPWGPCETCHSYEQATVNVHQASFQDAIEAWTRHLALDD